MAENVQYQLESMLNELHEFQEKGIFTSDETLQIVKKRTEFEYALLKRTSVKEDYLRYIEYEVNLEKLRRKRKQRFKIKGQKSLTDYSIVTHVQRIFEKACTKFPGDISLWITYTDFCKYSGSYHVANKAFARAIQFNPRNPFIWLAACKYEWEQMSDPTSTRIIFLRALRLCKDSDLLWLEYFRMELLFYVKIFERRRVLSEKREELIREQIKEQGIDLQQLPGNCLNQNNDAEKDDEEYFNGEIFQVIVKNALKNITSRLKFSQDLIKVLNITQNKFPTVKWDNLNSVRSLLDQESSQKS